MWRKSVSRWIAACALCGLPFAVATAQSPSGAAKQQSSPDPKPCSVVPDPDPCGTKPTPPGAANAPSTMDKFPFPGSGSAASSSAPGIGGAPSAPDAPAAPAAPAATGDSATPSDAMKKFPFPGESDAAPSAPAPSPEPGSSSSSSSNGMAGDPANSPDLKDAGSEGTRTEGRHILHRVNPPGTKLQSPDDREAEDLKVGKFYLDSGNLPGAYMRFQDAVKTIPDDPDAHFALAELAEKLGKRDEAVAEYNQTLKLDPTGRQIKDAQKALKKLQKHD